jgi:AraC-like DNA-binding protein/quercetin dioxygenase-like cupin family protein
LPETRSTTSIDEPSQPAVPRARFTDLNGVDLRLRLSSFAVEFLSFGFIPAAWWRNHLHQHSYFEICYAFAGRGVFRMLGREYPVRRGDVFVAKPGEEHEIISSIDDPMGIYFWSYTLRVEASPGPARPAARGAGQANGPTSVEVDRLLHAFLQSDVWVSARVPGMERTLELMTEEMVRREPGFVSVLEGLARKLVLDTARAAAGEAQPGEAASPRVKDPAHALAAQAARYIRDNHGRSLSVEQVAAQVNLSSRHLARIFRRVLKQSPNEYLLHVRMEQAAQLLLDPLLPVKEIAQRVGCPDVRYFTTLFRRQFGVPPAQFRAKGGTRFADPKSPRGSVFADGRVEK